MAGPSAEIDFERWRLGSPPKPRVRRLGGRPWSWAAAASLAGKMRYGGSTMSEIDLGALMQQAQQLQAQMEYLQKGLAEQTVEGTAGAGMVKATATGAGRVTALEIDPSVLGEDVEMLQDLVVAAVNNALDKGRALAQSQMSSMLPPGMKPPGT